LKTFELILAGLLLLGGVRSAVYWLRRRIEATRASHHVAFALFVTGRIGLWLSFAGFFALSASIPYEGRALVDAMNDYRWYAIVPMTMAGLQIIGGYFLGRGDDHDETEQATAGPEP
jgi:hypothetical protein